MNGQQVRSSPDLTDSLRSFWTQAVLSALDSLAMSFSFSIIPMTPGLDPSFAYSFNYAAAHRLPWGREFISTYGPYGYLVSTMDLGHLVANKIAASLLLAVSAGMAVAAYVRWLPGLGLAARIALILTLNYRLRPVGHELP